MAELLVFCHFNAPQAQDVLALLSHARNLAKQADLTLGCVYMGSELPAEAIAELSSYGCEKLYFLKTDAAIYTSGAAAKACADVIKNLSADIVLFSATNEDRVIAAQLAAHLQTGLTADCSELSVENGLLLQTRPAFGGNLFASILCPNHRPQMATVHPYIFPMGEKQDGMAEVVACEVNVSDRAALLSSNANTQKSISDAKVVLCGGAGLDKEDFALLAKICDATGAHLGATRVAVNETLAPYRCQIGQTGAGLRADLYVGFGVSGAVQHVAGMKNAKRIVAVNTDKKAPIADICDVFIHADAKDVLSHLAASLSLAN